MADEKLTLEEANKIEFREIDIEKLRASIPAILKEVERLEEMADECHQTRLRYRVY